MLPPQPVASPFFPAALGSSLHNLFGELPPTAVPAPRVSRRTQGVRQDLAVAVAAPPQAQAAAPAVASPAPAAPAATPVIVAAAADATGRVGERALIASLLKNFKQTAEVRQYLKYYGR